MSRRFSVTAVLVIITARLVAGLLLFLVLQLFFSHVEEPLAASGFRPQFLLESAPFLGHCEALAIYLQIIVFAGLAVDHWWLQRPPEVKENVPC